MPDIAPLVDAVYLTGPTASGKTPVGLELARHLNAEILSLDSMAVYRHMEIGTAKPTPRQQAVVPHHLIDLVDPDESFSLAQFVVAAHQAAESVRRRGRQPLFVGGTPLYLKSLLRGVFEGPAADWSLRSELQAEAHSSGTTALYARLRRVDPQTAARLHPNDTRRIIRALEVYAKTGQPISRFQQQFDHGRAAEACHVFVLQWPRDTLHASTNRRVEKMFQAGLVEETQRLVERFAPLSRTARQAVGYRQVLEHLEGQFDLPETIRRVQAKTRQFVRRQETWFRSLSECRGVPVDEGFDPAGLAVRILESIEAGPSGMTRR